MTIPTFEVSLSGDEITGPHSVPALQRAFLEGEIGLRTPLRLTGTVDWLPLQTWGELIYPSTKTQPRSPQALGVSMLARTRRTGFELFVGLLLAIIGTSNFFASFAMVIYALGGWIACAVSLAAALAYGSAGMALLVNERPDFSAARQSIGLVLLLFGLALTLSGVLSIWPDRVLCVSAAANGVAMMLLGVTDMRGREAAR